MKKIAIMFCAAAGLASLAAAAQQSGASSPSSTQTKINPATLVQVELNNDLDAKKAHAGDVFKAKLWDAVRSGDKVVLPQKTILVGHVVEAQPRTKEKPESKLTIAFDKALLKDGSEILLRGVVERVELTPMAVAAGAGGASPSYKPGLNPGSTTNIAMPSQTGDFGNDKNQTPTPGPTNIRDASVVIQSDPAAGTTVLTSANQNDVKLKHYATLDVRITQKSE